MRLGVEEFLKQAMSLREDQRIEIAEALLASVEPPGALPFDPEWMTDWVAECKRRVARIDSGVSTSHGWPEVRERAWRAAEEQSRG